MVSLGKGVVLALLAQAGFLVACTVAFAQKATDRDVHLHRLSPQDATLLQEMQRTDRTAIAAGKLALGRARGEAVKKYAQLVVDTHSKLLEEGNKVAKFKLPQVPPEDDRANAAVLQPLQATPDDRFDRAYLAWVLEVQGHALAAARRASSEASDPNVKALAANAAGHIENQLEIARELAQPRDEQPRRTPLGAGVNRYQVRTAPRTRLRAGVDRGHDETSSRHARERLDDQADPLVRHQPRGGQVEILPLAAGNEGLAVDRRMDHLRLATVDVPDATADEARIGDEVVDAVRRVLVPQPQPVQQPLRRPAARAVVEPALAEVLQIPGVAHRRMDVADVELLRAGEHPSSHRVQLESTMS